MKYNLTDSQKNLLRQVVKLKRDGRISESFEIELRGSAGCQIFVSGKPPVNDSLTGLYIAQINSDTAPEGTQSNFDALIRAECLHPVSSAVPSYSGRRSYAFTAVGYNAVDTNFSEDPSVTPASTFNTNFHAPSSGVQIGNHNRQHFVSAVQTISNMIEESAGAPEQKAEVKRLWKQVLDHPLTASILGGLAGTFGKQ